MERTTLLLRLKSAQRLVDDISRDLSTSSMLATVCDECKSTLTELTLVELTALLNKTRIIAQSLTASIRMDSERNSGSSRPKGSGRTSSDSSKWLTTVRKTQSSSRPTPARSGGIRSSSNLIDLTCDEELDLILQNSFGSTANRELESQGWCTLSSDRRTGPPPSPPGLTDMQDIGESFLKTFPHEM